MKIKLLLASAIAVAALGSPARAEFWIVRDNPTAQCHIVEIKPANPLTIVGNTAFKTREEASKNLETVCNE
jgi:hypothetical protein